MRLKSLFFPVVVLVSLFIFISYIWPEISNLKDINKKKIINEKSLQDVRNEQTAVKSIGTQLAGNSEIGTIISSYLPAKKAEEKIIGGINYLAADSGVFLESASVKDLYVEDPYGAMAVDSSASSESAASTEGAEGDPALALNDTNKLRFIETIIGVRGDYEKIKLFIDQVEKMPMLNDIKSLSISRVKETASSGSGDGETQQVSSNLLATMTINFGYMPLLEVDNNKLINFKVAFDTSAINVLKQYISQKIDSSNYLVGNTDGKGRPNPFIP